MRRLISTVLLLLNSALVSAADVSRLTDAELGRRIRLPAGFEIRVFVRNLSGPRFMTVGPDGLIYVSMPRAGSVGRLRDGDGKAERVEGVIDNLDRPHGLAFHEGKLYVAGTRMIWRLDAFREKNSTGKATPIVSNLADGDHSTRTIVFGRDGKLYVPVGSSCNACKDYAGLIYRISYKGKG